MTSVLQNNAASIEATGSPLAKSLTSNGLAMIDFSQALYWEITLAANTTIGQPVNAPPKWSRVVIRLVQDASGSRTVAFAASFRDIAAGLASGGAAGTSAIIELLYDGSSYQSVGGSTAFAVSGSNITVPTGQLTLTPSAPVIPTPVPLPGAGAITMTGNAPTIIRSNSTVITPAAGSMTLAGVAGKNDLGIAPGSEPLTLVGQPPSVTHA